MRRGHGIRTSTEHVCELVGVFSAGAHRSCNGIEAANELQLHKEPKLNMSVSDAKTRQEKKKSENLAPTDLHFV